MPNFTNVEGREWTINEGPFGEPVVGFFYDEITDEPEFISIAHIATGYSNKREVDANTRLILHAPDMYFLLQKIISTKKCVVSEVRDLLNKINGDEAIALPAKSDSKDKDNEHGED